MRSLITLAAIALLFSSLSAFAVGWLPLSGPGGGGGGGGSACVNGNLLLNYSDPCQLMSQMVGL